MRGLPMILTGLSVLSVAVPTVAQQAGEAVTVVAGSQYEAGGFHRFLFGSGYRDLWTMPIEVPVLDLENEAGGLEPLMVVGNLQTLGLALRGADGKSYTFRGVHKDLARVLPEELRDTAIADMVQDMLSASVPGAGLAAIPLAVVAGVRQPTPRLVLGTATDASTPMAGSSTGSLVLHDDGPRHQIKGALVALGEERHEGIDPEELEEERNAPHDGRGQTRAQPVFVGDVDP